MPFFNSLYLYYTSIIIYYMLFWIFSQIFAAQCMSFPNAIGQHPNILIIANERYMDTFDAGRRTVGQLIFRQLRGRSKYFIEHRSDR
jgi:hypothetical protein